MIEMIFFSFFNFTAAVFLSHKKTKFNGEDSSRRRSRESEKNTHTHTQAELL